MLTVTFRLILHAILVTAYSIPNVQNLTAQSGKIPESEAKTFNILQANASAPTDSVSPSLPNLLEDHCTSDWSWYTSRLNRIRFHADCIGAAHTLFIQDVHYGQPDQMYEFKSPYSAQRTALPVMRSPRRYISGK